MYMYYMFVYIYISGIFNLSFKTNIVPNDWKIARASPIFKAGHQCDCNNYRPIPVISAVAHIFEKLVFEKLEDYLTTNNLLNHRQSGFRSLFSTATALLDLTNEWCFNTDHKLVNGALFLDLKKAFDTVDHTLIIRNCNTLVWTSLHWLV